MLELVWEAFNGIFKALHRQGRRVEELERRVVELERRLQERAALASGAAVYGERPVLHVVEPEPQPLCGRCSKCHSPELPCAPVEEAAEVTA